jgi:hypothetical protein
VRLCIKRGERLCIKRLEDFDDNFKLNNFKLPITLPVNTVHYEAAPSCHMTSMRINMTHTRINTIPSRAAASTLAAAIGYCSRYKKSRHS